MTSRPLIAITGPDRGGAAAWIMTRAAIRRAGGRARRITPSRPDAGDFDALVIGGGADVDPVLYRDAAEALGELLLGASSPETPKASPLWAPGILLLRKILARDRSGRDPRRDALERTLLASAVERGLPVLGICRGAQLMNVHFGGTLFGDLRHFYVERPQLRTVLPKNFVRITPGSHLAKTLGATECGVNALHRQAIRSVGRGFEIVARERSGVVQAIEQRDHPFRIGVQWHPEYMPQERTQRALFEALVETARQRGETTPEVRQTFHRASA